jgi:hypothetical protein
MNADMEAFGEYKGNKNYREEICADTIKVEIEIELRRPGHIQHEEG